MLKDIIKLKNKKSIIDYFEETNIVDFSLEVAELDFIDQLFVLKLLDKQDSAEVFSYFETEIQTALIEQFNQKEIVSVIDNLYSDDLSDLLGELPANLVKKVITSATTEQRKMINVLLSYPEDSAGSIMNTNFIELKENMTNDIALELIRKQGQNVETIHTAFVVDKKRVLLGSLSLKDILVHERNEPVTNLMDENIVFVTTHTDQEKVLELMKKYDLYVIAVVNDDNCLIGIITIDDIIDILEEQITEDIHKMAAISPTDEEYLQTSVLKMTMSRVPWLLLLMLGSIITEVIINGFEESLSVLPVLSAFVPMIMGTSGNAGNQTAVMIIRGIAVDGLSSKDLWKVFFKESKISIIMAVVMFVVALIRILVLPPSVTLDVAFCVALGLGISLFLSNIIGGVLPIISLMVKQDPAAMAAPLITNIVDVVSLVVYFYLCTTILGI